MSSRIKFLDENYFDENPELKERAEKLSDRWEEILAEFTLPCPMCNGEMMMQGVSPTRLYEFAEGEPGSVNPLDLLPISFICDRCGYLAEFDSQLFNPAYLARLEGARPEKVAHLSVREYRVLVPLRGDEHNYNLLDLATAIAKNRNGEIIVLDASSSQNMSNQLVQKLQNYRPGGGRPAPVKFIGHTTDPLSTNFTQAILKNRCSLLMIEARGWGGNAQAGIAPLIEGILRDDLCEVAIVNDRGLEQINRVLLATSGGPNARAAVPLALDIVRAFDAEFHLLTVVPPNEPEAKENGFTRIAETIGSHDIEGIKVQKHILADANPLQAVISESANYDLLILGGSPRDWRSKIRLNSFSATVARNSDTTSIVLITPGDQPLSFLSRLLGL